MSKVILPVAEAARMGIEGRSALGGPRLPGWQFPEKGRRSLTFRCHLPQMATPLPSPTTDRNLEEPWGGPSHP